MAQYLLAVQLVDGESAEHDQADVEALNEEMATAGVWLFAAGLRPRDTWSVVRHKGDEVLVTDGPFAESKEYMAGFWVLETPDLAAAQGWAAKASTACRRPIEVTPLDVA